VLAMDGTAPYYAPAAGEDRYARPGEFPGPLTPVLATGSADGKQLYLVIANGSWDRPVECRAALKNFRATTADGVVLTHRDPDASPLLQRKEDAVGTLPVKVGANQITCTLPPRAVVFLTLR
ncbi:MAG: hypothetical protein QHJ73_13930, partial [Armatimonadota bacterium]|nr:hypothetical protein [Armatimonadota bacterium]